VNSKLPAWPAPLELLPHGPQACYLDRILDFTPGRKVTAQWTVRGDCALFDPQCDGVPGWAGLEIMAQCSGLYLGLSRARGKPQYSPTAGYLVGARRIDVHEPVLPLDAVLSIEAVCEVADLSGDELGNFECRILCAGKLCATARLMLWCGATDQGKT